jgi:integrase
MGMASIAKRANGQYRARYRDASGKEHSRHFARKTDAQRWLNEVTASVVTGQYVDPKGGRVTFRDYAELWRVAQVHRPTSQAHVESVLRRHAYPFLGDKPMSSILPSEIQAWVKRLSTGAPGAGRKPLAPKTVGVIHSIVSAVFKAAVRDRRIVANPCVGTKLPRVERKRVVPPTTAEVEMLVRLLPDDLRAVVTFCAGTGVRQGECMGLTVDRIDFLRREVHIERQLRAIDEIDRPVFGPPKTDASVRTIPLPQVVVDSLAHHLAHHPAGEHGLVFTLEGRPITRSPWGHVWRPIARQVGLPWGTGLHSLRHYYASLLIRHGESVKTVQARLGHATAAETLDTYSHLWPDSDDRTREAIDSVMRSSAPTSPGFEARR